MNTINMKLVTTRGIYVESEKLNKDDSYEAHSWLLIVALISLGVAYIIGS